MLTCISADAQRGRTYGVKVTAKNVNLRVGPGKNYRIQEHYGTQYCTEGEKVQYERGEILLTDGVKRNGYTHVVNPEWGQAIETCWTDGWVPSQYLTLAKKCRICNGKFLLNRKCPTCNGQGWSVCCFGTGKAICNSCHNGYN